MTATNFSQLGLSIQMYRPAIEVGVSYVPTGISLGRLSNEVSTWTHEIQADGGYWSAEFSLQGNPHEIDDWLAGGLGRHIVCHDESHLPVWEGFVNRVAISFGPLTIERGPLMDIGNRVEAYYTPIIDDTTEPPLTGDEQTTPIVEDARSQRRWGIVEKVLNAGQISTDEVEQIVSLYIAENRNPKTAKDLNLVGGAGGATITVSCLGYVHWLDNYMYNSLATATTTASDKIEAVLGADPNGMFSLDYNPIKFNGTLVGAYENASRSAWTIIKEILVLGGGSDERWNFGVYAGQTAAYKAIPTTYSYLQNLGDPGQTVLDYASKAAVPPWRIMPGTWLFYADLLIGRVYDTSLNTDPRAQFIESVTFTAPNGVHLAGSQIGKLSQRLARLGLGGL